MAITIHINADGTGRYVSDSSTRDIALGSVGDTRQALIDMAAKEAARQGREIPVIAHDTGQRFDILVSERGTARTNPDPRPADDFIADVPGMAHGQQHGAPAAPAPAPMISAPPMQDDGSGPGAAPGDDALSEDTVLRPAHRAAPESGQVAATSGPSAPAIPAPGGRSAATADSAPTGPSAASAASASTAPPAWSAPALPEQPLHQAPRSPHLAGPQPTAPQATGAAALSPAAAPQGTGSGWSMPGATDWSAPATAPAAPGPSVASAAPAASAPSAASALSAPSAAPAPSVAPAADDASAAVNAPAAFESPVVAGPPPSGPSVDENDPAWREIAEKPAEQGLRGTLNGLGMKLAPTEAELEERRAAFAAQKAQEQRRQAEEEQRRLEEEERARAEAEAQRAHESRQAARQREAAERDREQRRLIQTNYMGVKTILVANPKGGARKTTSTYLLAATMGIIRGGSVIAWDANETMGTLGERSQQDQHAHTVVDLLEQAAPSFTSIEGSRLGALDAYVRPQGDSHFDVLASDEDATRQDIVDREGFETVHEILSRFYRLILVDTGNNIRVPHFLAAVDQADQLVIPVAAGRDSARAAMKMMRSLEASGHGDLVKDAVVLLHDLEPSTEAGSDYLDTVGEIAAEFEGQVAAVVAIPFDASLKGGDQIDHAKLSPATQQAYQEAAAAVAKSLRDGLARDDRKAAVTGAETGTRADRP